MATKKELDPSLQVLLDGLPRFPAEQGSLFVQQDTPRPAERISPSPKLLSPNPECPTCSGSGFKIIEKNGASGTQRCDCGTVPHKSGSDSIQEELEFLDIAQRARLIPGVTSKMIPQIAVAIRERCAVELTHEGERWSRSRQAQWLIKEASSWEKWSGEAGLNALYNAKFKPTLKMYKSPEALDLGYRCKKCWDSASVIVDGHYEWCGCEGARSQKEIDPLMVERQQSSLERAQRKQCLPLPPSRIFPDHRVRRSRRKARF